MIYIPNAINDALSMKILNDIKPMISIPTWLALLVAINGYLVLKPVLYRAVNQAHHLAEDFRTWKEALSFLGLLEIPQFMIGCLLMIMAMALFLKARTACFFSVLLLFIHIVIDVFILNIYDEVTTYSIVLMLSLVFFWKNFDYYSLGSAAFFSIVSIALLIVYSMLGTLYLGDQFSPAVTDLSTAFYFAIVCMSTVGFGDIIPTSGLARLFTSTVVISGITIFATSIASIAGPLMSNKINRIVSSRRAHMVRKNHFIIIGTNPFALNVFHGLRNRGDNVTAIYPEGEKCDFPYDGDIIEGDPSDIEVLKLAGADCAKYIIVLCNSDAETVFTLLAAKEITGPETKTLAVVNQVQNINKVKRIAPDMMFSLPLLGSVLLVKALNGESIDNELITKMLFENTY